ncbi:uncharacterized protein LOC123298718 [Chrysoperla carnea]|uniref:uncharacterized protein LOC123298718 n=1 Tax=Chrysoperla carnea TaxID=189513 RepID=UPI001D074450|nr:uncharacterized protein LOC123298718 [Chrysoperla carnea]
MILKDIVSTVNNLTKSKRFELFKTWTPSVINFVLASTLLTVYFTEWRAVLKHIPSYKSKYANERKQQVEEISSSSNKMEPSKMIKADLITLNEKSKKEKTLSIESKEKIHVTGIQNTNVNEYFPKGTPEYFIKNN